MIDLASKLLLDFLLFLQKSPLGFLQLWEGQTRLFEMTDAQTVSADAIAAADKKLPALSDTDTTDTRSSEEVEADVSNRTLYLTAGIAVVIVVVVVIFLVLD